MNKISKKVLSKKLDIKSYEFALSYCRVSSKKQEIEGRGLDSQETRNENLALQHGLKIEKTFPDTFSGGGDFMKRPAMSELIEYLDSHPHKRYVIIFDDLKRFARDTKFHFELRAALSARNALPLCSNFVFDDTPEGVFVETIQAAHNQLEREQNRRQVIEKQKACLERGYWAFHSPYGYRKAGRGSDRRDEPNEQNKYIKGLFEGYFTGQFLNFTDGARYLKEVGVLGNKHAEKYIETVRSILTRVFYAGYIEYPLWEVGRRKGVHTETVSLELFEAVQKKISRNFNTCKIRQDINPDFPLRGCINCDLCGGKLTGAWTRGKSKLFAYYFCQKKGCPLKGSVIRKKNIEDGFNDLLKEMTTDDDILELSKAVFIAVKEKDEKEVAINKRIEQKRKQEIEEEIDTYAVLAGKTKIESVVIQYEKKMERLAAELEEIESNSSLEYDYSVPYRTALDKTLCILKNPYETWINLDVFQQQKFFSFFFEENLIYCKKEGYRTPKYTVLKRVFKQIEHAGSVDVEMGGFEPPSIRVFAMHLQSLVG